MSLKVINYLVSYSSPPFFQGNVFSLLLSVFILAFAFNGVFTGISSVALFSAFIAEIASSIILYLFYFLFDIKVRLNQIQISYKNIAILILVSWFSSRKRFARRLLTRLFVRYLSRFLSKSIRFKFIFLLISKLSVSIKRFR